jgi:hypothetical protein
VNKIEMLFFFDLKENALKAVDVVPRVFIWAIFSIWISFFSFFSKMTMSVKQEPQKTAGPQECAGCGKKIQDR